MLSAGKISATDRSQKSTNLLDVTVSLIESQIEANLYVKPTDSHQNLHYFSCHPLPFCKVKHYTLSSFVPEVNVLKLIVTL